MIVSKLKLLFLYIFKKKKRKTFIILCNCMYISKKNKYFKLKGGGILVDNQQHCANVRLYCQYQF